MKLSFEFEADANPHTIAKRLRSIADTFSKPSVKTAAVEEDDTEMEDEETEETPAPKKTKAKAKVAADDFGDEDDGESEEEAEEVEAPPKKKKAAKLSIADVNKACQDKAKDIGKAGVKEVRAILKKKFKVDSVSDLDESQWPAVIKAMEV